MVCMIWQIMDSYYMDVMLKAGVGEGGADPARKLCELQGGVHALIKEWTGGLR